MRTPLYTLASSLHGASRCLANARQPRLPAALCLVLCSCFGLVAGSSRAADDSVVAIVGATVHVAGDDSQDSPRRVIPDGVIVSTGGKISAVGPRAEVAIPEGARRIDAGGLHASPGLVDLRGHLLAPDKRFDVYRVNPTETVADGADPFDAAWRHVRDAGVTTVAVGSWRGTTQSGAGMTIKLRQLDGSTADPWGGLLLARDSHVVFALGASSTTSTSAQRLEQYYRLRKTLESARDYKKAWEDYWKAVDKYNEAAKKFNEAVDKAAAEKKNATKKAEPKKDAPKKPTPPKSPSRNIASEILVRALDGKLPVLLEAHRRDDIEYARRIREEFGLEFTLVGGTRAAEFAKALADSGTRVALEPVLLNEDALEYRGHSESTAAQLAEAGVHVAITSAASSATGSRYLRLQACAAVRGGLDRETALRALTLEPARALGLDDRIGSLEKGKDADIVLFDGEPLDARSQVVQVIVEGRPGARSSTSSKGRWSSPAARKDSKPSQANLGESQPLALVGGRVVVVDPFTREVRVRDKVQVIVRDGKITQLIEGADKLPEGVRVHDLAGRWLLPGFVDAASHVTLKGDYDDLTYAINEDLRVLDGFDPWDAEIEFHLRRGVTSVALSPGKANVVGGKISVTKLVPRTIPARVVSESAGLKASIHPDFTAPRYPTAVSGAIESLESWLASRPGELRKQPVVVYFEALAEAERVLASAAGANANLIFLEGIGTDAETFAGLPSGQPVILGPYSTREPERVLRAGSRLSAQRRPFAYSSGESRADLLTSVLLSIQYGLDEGAAFRALTSTPASLFGVADRIGRIAESCDADLVVWSDNPFTGTGRVEQVFVDGQLILDGDRVFEGRVGNLPAAGKLGESRRKEILAESTEAKVAASTIATALEAGFANGPPRLIRARKVYPVSSEPIENGEVLVRGGKIVAVGKRGMLDAKGAEVVEVEGSLVPGFVNAGSKLGLSGRFADEFRELTPDMHASDGVRLRDEQRRRALVSGVTTAAITAGERNVIGGFGGVFKTHGAHLASALLDREPFVSLSLTPNAASGNRSLRSGAPTTYLYRIPTTRMGTVFLARRALLEAQNDGWPKGPDAAGALASGLRDMLEPSERLVLRQVIEGKRRLRISADTDAEIRTALRIGEEFGVRVQIEGGREAIHVIEQLKAARAEVILDLGDGWSLYELEANPHVSARLPAELAAAGVPFAFQLENPSSTSDFRELALMTQREGLGANDVLAAMTLHPARVLGVDKRVGSLEAGKDADLVAISGDPLAATSSVLWVLVDGVKISRLGVAEDTQPAKSSASPEAISISNTSNTF